MVNLLRVDDKSEISWIVGGVRHRLTGHNWRELPLEINESEDGGCATQDRDSASADDRHETRLQQALAKLDRRLLTPPASATPAQP